MTHLEQRRVQARQYSYRINNCATAYRTCERTDVDNNAGRRVLACSGRQTVDVKIYQADILKELWLRFDGSRVTAVRSTPTATPDQKRGFEKRSATSVNSKFQVLTPPLYEC